MNPQKAFSSSIGSKFLIAFTGLALLVFLIAHLAGNLLFIAGPDAFNEYSHKLISNPLIYVAEAGLLAVFVLHIFKTVAMFGGSYAARPQRYAKKKWARTKNDRSRKSVSSTTMILTGTITLLFVVTLLMSFKFGAYYDAAEPGVRDLYRLTLEVFHNPVNVIWYVVAMVLVGMHLRHGITSALQSLGAIPDRLTRKVLAAGAIVAFLIAAGFAMIPVWVYLFTQ
jgi:succinate dehydrogenase / fumarate reductase cytochrome b subunit